MSAAKATSEHNEIRKWVEERGGQPARVKGTESGEDPGLLGIDYPGFGGEENLEPIVGGILESLRRPSFRVPLSG
jgi:hypothetical protein